MQKDHRTRSLRQRLTKMPDWSIFMRITFIWVTFIWVSAHIVAPASV